MFPVDAVDCGSACRVLHNEKVERVRKRVLIAVLGRLSAVDVLIIDGDMTLLPQCSPDVV